MKNNLFKICFFVLFIFSFIVGFSAWLIVGENLTSEEINNSINEDNTVNLNVNYQTRVNETTSTLEYYIPKTWTVDYDIRDTDVNGNTSYQAYQGGDITLNETNGDKIIQLYDVINGKYTKINQHSNTNGPEQIKSLSIDVTERELCDNETDYGNVWDTNVTLSDGSNYPLRFACDSGNGITGHGHKYEIGDLYQSDIEISNTTETIDNQTITTIIYQRIVVYDRVKIVYGTKKEGCTNIDYCVWCYYPRYQMRMVRIINTNTGDIINHNNVNTIKVKKGSRISPFELGVENYQNYGYFSDETYSNFFDFNAPIEEDTNIFLKFISPIGTISKSIDSLTSGQTLSLYDVYKGGSGSQVDISKDPTYDIDTNTVFIDEFVLGAGSTLNFTFKDEQIYISPITGSLSENLGNHRTTIDNNINPEYKSTTYVGRENCSLYVLLNGDATIKGTLNIGAEIGGYNASSCYSYIIGDYAVLDLYGHDLIVDGGTINAFGIIKDSIGTGKIIVKNEGKIFATTTVTDGRGRDQTAVGLSKRQSPFTEYKFSYLQVPIYFYNGTTFQGYLKLDFDALGIININIEIIGKTYNSALFSWNSSNSEDYIFYEPYIIEELYTQNTNTIYLQMHYQRIRFHFHSNIRAANSYILEAKLSSSYGTLDGSFDFARIDFPISPFFDFIIYENYEFEIGCKMTFYPGSSLYVKESAKLKFTYLGNKSFKEISMVLTIAGETRYIAGGIMSYTSRISDSSSAGFNNSRFTKGVYNQASYWNYIKPGNIVIDGNIEFQSGIDTSYNDGFYYLSGNIVLSEKSLIDIKNNRNMIKTYDVKSELQNGFFYNSNNQTLQKQYEFATSYNLNPLISGDKAFIIDNNFDLRGNFDPNEGVFHSDDGKNYFLKMDNDMYDGGSSTSNQGDKIDRNINIEEVSLVRSNERIVKDYNSNYYVFYSGIYIPVNNFISSGDIDTSPLPNNFEVNVNARKFMSNSGADYSITMKKITVDSEGNQTSTSVTNIVSSCFNSLILRYNASAKKWSYYCFNDYRKSGDFEWYTY